MKTPQILKCQSRGRFLGARLLGTPQLATNPLKSLCVAGSEFLKTLEKPFRSYMATSLAVKP